MTSEQELFGINIMTPGGSVPLWLPSYTSSQETQKIAQVETEGDASTKKLHEKEVEELVLLTIDEKEWLASELSCLYGEALKIRPESDALESIGKHISTDDATNSLEVNRNITPNEAYTKTFTENPEKHVTVDSADPPAIEGVDFRYKTEETVTSLHAEEPVHPGQPVSIANERKNIYNDNDEASANIDEGNNYIDVEKAKMDRGSDNIDVGRAISDEGYAPFTDESKRDLIGSQIDVCEKLVKEFASKGKKVLPLEFQKSSEYTGMSNDVSLSELKQVLKKIGYKDEVVFHPTATFFDGSTEMLNAVTSRPIKLDEPANLGQPTQQQPAINIPEINRPYLSNYTNLTNVPQHSINASGQFLQTKIQGGIQESLVDTSSIPTNVSQYSSHASIPTNVPQFSSHASILTNVPQYSSHASIPTNVPQYSSHASIPTNVPQYSSYESSQFLQTRCQGANKQSAETSSNLTNNPQYSSNVSGQCLQTGCQGVTQQFLAERSLTTAPTLRQCPISNQNICFPSNLNLPVTTEPPDSTQCSKMTKLALQSKLNKNKASHSMPDQRYHPYIRIETNQLLPNLPEFQETLP